jgi:tetratricopeptide (TPR) repeat protein
MALPMPVKRKGRFAVIAALVVGAIVAVAVLYRSRPAERPRRVIVVGLDGADWQLLDDLIGAGAMPELGRLVREGRPGVLRSIVPPLSPLVWTTIATGRSPLEHRILDFTRFHPLTGVREPITSDERRVKALWEMAGQAEREVAVFGLWATHPAEPVRGLIVSDRLFSFQRNEARVPPGAVHPASEEGRVLAARQEVEAQVSLAELQKYLPWLSAAEYEGLAARADPHTHPVSALGRILVETRLYHRVAADWLERAQPALAFVYFQGTDSIGHVFAPYAPPRLPTIPEADFERYGRVPEAYFREVDAILGEYRRLAERSGAALVIVSDHGFLWKEGRPARPDSLAQATAGLWHRAEGVYLLWGQGLQPAPRGEGRVGQVAATVLALLGLPRGAGLDGPALGGLPENQEVRDYGPRAVASVAPADPAAQEALEKLRALGYVGAAEPGRRAPAASAKASTRTAGSFNNEGLLLIEAGRLDEARSAFEQALKIDPHRAAAAQNLSGLIATSDPPRADALLLGALADGLGDGPRIVLERAVAYQQAGDVRRARRLLEGAVKSAPADVPLRLKRGSLRIEARECASALEDFDAARRAAPDLAIAHGLAGTALLCLGRTTEARSALERSLALDPSQTRLRQALAGLGN